MADPKYVLCRPVSGLNGTLNQIALCRDYAIKYGRILLVDGRYSGVLGDFFRREGDGQVLKTTDEGFPDIDMLDCLPKAVQGRVSSIRSKASQVPGQKLAVDVESEVPLTFPFDRDHPETLLLHQQWGGGRRSFDMIGRLTILPWLAMRVRNFIARLPHGYITLHVRNTDYKTDVPMALDAIRAKVAGQNLLLCSDDVGVHTAVVAGLPDTRVHIITAPAYDDGKPQHVKARFAGMAVRRQVATGSIVDLCALAMATTLYVPVLHSWVYGDPNAVFTGVNRLSGFGMLASYLCEDKDRLRRLLGDPGPGLRPRLKTGKVDLIEAPPLPSAGSPSA